MKSILVIDMPKDCRECPCFYHWLRCQAKDGINVCGNGIPRGCPLKSMPERIPTNEYGYMTPYGSVWNACINEILGEEE